MKRKYLSLLGPLTLLSLFGAPPAHALQPLTESDMAEVTGREGITLDIDLRLNSDTDGTPLIGDGITFSLTNRNGAVESDAGAAYTGPAFFKFEGLHGRIVAEGVTLDSDGEKGLVIGLPDEIEVHQLSTGVIHASAVEAADGNYGPALGELLIDGTFNTTGTLTVWGH